jgi:hypothetical protein
MRALALDSLDALDSTASAIGSTGQLEAKLDFLIVVFDLLVPGVNDCLVSMNLGPFVSKGVFWVGFSNHPEVEVI